MLAHEVAHVRQGHTRQRLLLEVARALLWFNPFAHLFPRALAQIHEFLADAAALRTLQPAEATAAPPDPASYAALLARLALRQLSPHLALTHSFTHSLTLTRIRMLTTAAPAHRWKRWLPLPLSASLLLLVACEQDLDNVLPPPPPPVAANATTPPPPPPPPAYTYVEQMPEYAGGQTQLLTDIGRLTQYPPIALNEKLEGKVFVRFIIGADGSMQAIDIQKGIETSISYSDSKGEPQTTKIVTPAAQALNAAALNAVRNLPGKWTPGRQEGKAVAVEYTIPITFSLK
ncbi:energy transducer TonB [Hymenobacter lapidiphilus]|uniref:energy transducer TonB n=1 Tax=Hymenobacter sp. CCM 8763 TaxID=2303334 RepID=UPI001F5BF597|nr:energy transducer TonB [Hymenobacter sp. CCM 8763]